MAYQKGLGKLDATSLSFVYNNLDKLHDPTCREKMIPLKKRKVLQIEDKRVVAATRDDYSNWFTNCKEFLYKEYNIVHDWQIANMDETYAAL